MEYRLLRTDPVGSIDNALTMTLPNDDLALAWGRLLGCGYSVQVWRGDTCLATLDPAAGYYGSFPEPCSSEAVEEADITLIARL